MPLVVAPAIGDALVVCQSKSVREERQPPLIHARTVEHHAQVVRRRGPLAREVKLAVGALGLVYEHDTLAELDGRPQLELVSSVAGECGRERKRKGASSEACGLRCYVLALLWTPALTCT